MGSLSIWHWGVVLIVIAGYVVPLGIICKKAGFSPLWALLSLIPVLSIVVLWVLAISEWEPRYPDVSDRFA